MACTARRGPDRGDRARRAARPGRRHRRACAARRTRVRFPAPDRLVRPPRGDHRRRRPGRPRRQPLPHASAASTTSCSNATASCTTGATPRWDAFCLVTPNWQCALPGHPYPGDDPDGFMVKDEILDYVEPLRRRGKPIYEGVDGRRASRPGLQRRDEPRHAHRRPGRARGRRLPRPARPATTALPGIHSTRRYRNPESLPDGAGARRRHRPVRRADRRGPAPRGTRRCTSPSAPPRASPASTAAATASPGCRTWATTTCRSPSTRRARPRARRPTTT